MPFAVIGSEKDIKTQDGRMVKGRQYSWGTAEVENEDHCDFKKLRSILIRTHMLDLIHTTEEMHYEAYRAQQMETRKFGEARPRKLDNPKFKEEEESLRKRFTEQVKVEENRFRQWEQKLISERDRLNKDLENTHAQYVQPEICPSHKLLNVWQDQKSRTRIGAGARQCAAKPWPRSLEELFVVLVLRVVLKAAYAEKPSGCSQPCYLIINQEISMAFHCMIPNV